METQTNIQQTLLLAFSDVFAQIIAYIPNLLAAVAVILIGHLLSKWIKWLIVKVLQSLKISAALRKTPLENFLEKAEINLQIEVIIGDIARWLILIIFFITALNLIGLTTVSAFLSSILSYLPTIFSAILILVIGTISAGIVESLVKSSLVQVSLITARTMSRVASYLVMIFTLLAVFAELGIAENLINILFVGIIATLALGLGLAFGLGAKDLVAKILDDWYSQQKRNSK